MKTSGGVILCAGGFVMNEQMIKQYAPKLTRCNTPVGNPGDTGTGIQMGMSVGAGAINMHEGFTSMPFYPPSTLTYGIIVTDKGQRFINEDAYHGRVASHLLEQNSERFYFIVDVESYGDYEKLNFLNADVVATGESPEELEQELGLPRDSLAHTLGRYNEHAAEGVDPLYHKQAEWLRPLEAPYVALDITPGRGVILPYFTLGGLDTRPTGEVLKVDGTVIPGLYAAGRTACGVPRRGSGYNSGISIGDATFRRPPGQAVPPQRGWRHDEALLMSMITTPVTLLDDNFIHSDSSRVPLSVHIEIRVPGRIDASRLRTAVARAVQLHPIARARLGVVEWQSKTLHWEVTPELELDPITVVSADTPEELLYAREQLVATRVPLEASPPFRVFLVHYPGGDYLILNVNHAAGDGIGTLRLMRSITRAYAEQADDDGGIDPIEAARCKHHTGVG